VLARLKENIMAKLPVVGIEYCQECGYLTFAMKLADELLRDLEGQLGGVLLTPSAGGAYEITLDGRSIYSTFEEGFPSQMESVGCVRESLTQAATA